MKILVCLTYVPDTTSKITFTDGNKKFNSQNVQFIIGPYDEYALSRAVEIRDAIVGSTVTVLNVGMPESDVILRKALAIGADDAIRINTNPVDSYYVAVQIAEIAKKGNYDLILMGKESIDYNGNLVHGMVAAMLGIPCINPILKLDVAGSIATVTKEIEGGKQIIKINLPFVAGCQEPIAEWKIPNMRGIMSAKNKPLVVLEAIQVQNHAVTDLYELPPPKPACVMIDAATPEKLFDYLKL